MPYDALLSGELRLPSWIGAMLPADAPPPSVSDVLERVRASDLPVLSAEPTADFQSSAARWQVEITLDRHPEPVVVHLWAEPTEPVLEFHLEWARLRPEDVEASRASRWTLTSSVDFGDHPLGDFHAQLQLLHRLAPDAVCVVDLAACWPRPGAWLEEVASTAVPPSPTNLYCIHAVRDDHADVAWLHTHGLLRCGLPELEMYDVPLDDAGTLARLLNAAAAMFLDQGVPEPDTVFSAGMGLDLLWVPWERGVRHLGRDRVGGRQDHDHNHDHPVAALFAPARKVLGLFGGSPRNPACYLPILDANPLLYVSSAETARMALLARERLPVFVALHERLGEQDDWMFLVKIGYPIEGADDEGQREHLWFRLHAIHGDRVEATLLNAPYHVSALNEGDRGLHALADLSDWQVFCPAGRFDPDTIVHLRRALDSGDL